jgi:hypothetical protein
MPLIMPFQEKIEGFSEIMELSGGEFSGIPKGLPLLLACIRHWSVLHSE